MRRRHESATIDIALISASIKRSQAGLRAVSLSLVLLTAAAVFLLRKSAASAETVARQQ